MTIRTKLGLLVSGLVIVSVGLAGLVHNAAERRALAGERRERAGAEAQRLSRLGERGLTAGDFRELLSADLGPFAYLLLVRSDGPTLFRRAAAGVAEPPNEDGVRRALSGRRPVEGPLAAGGRVLREHVVPLAGTSDAASPDGLRRPRAVALRAGYDEAEAEAAVARVAGRSLRRFLGAALLSLAAGLAGAAWLARSITRAIAKLVSGAQRVGEGHFSARVLTRRDDELGELSDEFNVMGRKLAELESLKDSFLAKITHDLRSPLGAIIGHAELMLMGSRGPISESQAESMRVVIQSGQDLAELIDNILDVTKLEAGRLSFSPTKVSLRPAVHGVLDLLAAKAAEYGVTLDASRVPAEPAVWADEQALRRVLTNLVSNALKFTPKDGTVFVEWSREPLGGDRVTVRDTGIGIPADKLPTLFTKFAQVSETMHKVRYAKGTGLGLVICKELVEGHGGRVWAESESGRGSAFCFTLPPGPA